MTVLKRAKFKREKDREVEVDRQFSPETLALIAREAEQRVQKNEERKAQHTKAFVDDNALALIAMATGADLTDKTKKFSIPKKEKGLIIAR